MKEKVIYLAGGCFWGVSHLMQQIPGVTAAICGYANGKSSILNPSYEDVKTGLTDYKETVMITYDSDILNLETILLAFFYVINPKEKNRQENDIGSQYQTGIFYLPDDLSSKAIIDKIYNLEKGNETDFYVLLEPIKNFYSAEEYHQDYLIKNPNGYCHIPFAKMKIFKSLKILPSEYTKKAKELIK